MKAMEKDWYQKNWTLDIQNMSWVEDTNRQVDFLKYLHRFCVCNIISIFTILPSIFHFLLKYNLTEKNKDLMKIYSRME